MKKEHQNPLLGLKSIKLMKDNKLEGGFEFIAHSQLIAITAGAVGSNNCHGGNCVSGCGTTNTALGCGTVNTVPGCGVT